MPGHGDQEQRVVAAAANHPLGRLAVRAERGVVERPEQPEHLVGVAGIDLGQPVGGDAMPLELVVIEVVEHQLVGGVVERGQVRWQRSEPGCELTGIAEHRLPEIPSDITHRSLLLIGPVIPVCPAVRADSAGPVTKGATVALDMGQLCLRMGAAPGARSRAAARRGIGRTGESGRTCRAGLDFAGRGIAGPDVVMSSA